MIIGNGDIAKAIKDRKGFTFLASGISNSKEVRLYDHLRERDMILKYSPNHIVYFSSLCIYYADTEYAHHKKLIEKYIRETCNNYTIIRLGNITWGDNQSTLINHFKKFIDAGQKLYVEDTYRYLIDEEELNHWIGLIPFIGKNEMNITGRMIKVADIVEEIKKGNL